MKLGHTPGREPKLKAIHMLRQEAEPVPEFDLRQVVADMILSLRSKIAEQEDYFIEFGDRANLVRSLSAVRLVEETLKLDILGADRDRLLEVVHAVPNGFWDSHQISSLLGGDVFQDEWIQLFPRERAFKQVSDELLFQTQQDLEDRHLDDSQLDPLDFSTVVKMCVLRPDKKSDLAALVTFSNFKEWWENKQEMFTSRSLSQFLAAFASYLLLHPEERTRLALTEAEQQQALKLIRGGKYGRTQTLDLLKNAAIVLAERAEIDERGKIQVTWAAPKIPSQVPLPVRTQF